MINQEFFKEHENLKHCKVYCKIMLPWRLNSSFGCQFSSLLSRHIRCLREFPKSTGIGNSFLVVLGCPKAYSLHEAMGNNAYRISLVDFTQA